MSERVAPAVICILVGLFIMVLPPLLGEPLSGDTLDIILFGLVWVVTGSLVIWGKRLFAWTVGKLPALAVLGRGEVIGSSLATLVGTAIMLICLLAPEESFPAGRAPAVAAGLVFLVTGVAIGLPLLSGNVRAQTVVGALLLTAFAAVPLLIAIGAAAGTLDVQDFASLGGSLVFLVPLAGLGWWTVFRRRRRQKRLGQRRTDRRAPAPDRR